MAARAGGETARNRFEDSELQHTLTIPMRARGKQRPRVYGKRTITPPETVAAEKRIAAEWQAARLPVVEGPVRVSVRAIYAMPASWSKRRRLMMDGAWCESGAIADADNCLKLCLDALNEVAFADDRHIADARIQKLWGRTDSLAITVEHMADTAGKRAIRAAVASGEVSPRDVDACLNIHHDAMEAEE